MCGKKIKFFVNYDKWSEQSRNLHYEALKTLKMLWFPALCQWTLPDTLVHLDPIRRLTAFRAPKLHWQLALTRERSTPKLIFQNSTWLYTFKTNVLAKLASSWRIFQLNSQCFIINRMKYWTATLKFPFLFTITLFCGLQYLECIRAL